MISDERYAVMKIMTIPSERYASVIATQEFLRDLSDPKITPKVPRWIRERAFDLLRHYPGEYYMNQAAEKMPYIFQKEPNPLYNFVKGL